MRFKVWTCGRRSVTMWVQQEISAVKDGCSDETVIHQPAKAKMDYFLLIFAQVDLQNNCEQLIKWQLYFRLERSRKALILF